MSHLTKKFERYKQETVVKEFKKNNVNHFEALITLNFVIFLSGLNQSLTRGK